jgi:hypothetical protein
MKRRARSFTLIETLIALALTAMVVTFLTYFFHQITVVSQKSEALQQKSFKMRYIENRLSQVFPRTVSAETAAKDFYFFSASEPEGIIFTYDNQADKNKAFGNHVLGRIFLGDDHNLYLATWPSPQRWTLGVPPPMKLEVLLTGVKEMAIEYFVPPDRHWKPNFIDPTQIQKPQAPPKTAVPNQPAPNPSQPKAIEKPAGEGTWTREWKQEYELLPGLIRLRLQLDKETWQFVFPLPQTQRQVLYS